MVDSLQFIGTATTLLRLGPFIVLTDPNFLHRGQRAYLGWGLSSPRLTEPAMSPAELPPVDVVVLSHLHGDHFDRVSRRELDREPPVVTTPHASRQLRRWGFTAQGLSTWESMTLNKGEHSLTLESLPGVHARGPLRRLLPPVMGTILTHRVGDSTRRRVYLSGDTLTGDHVDLISERHPDIDVAVVHLGGTRVLLHTVTMDAGQGVDFVRRCSPGTVLPVHYNDYRVFRSPLSAFQREMVAAGWGDRLQVVKQGASVVLH